MTNAEITFQCGEEPVELTAQYTPSWGTSEPCSFGPLIGGTLGTPRTLVALQNLRLVTATLPETKPEL